MVENITAVALLLSSRDNFQPTQIHGNSMSRIWQIVSKAMILQAEDGCERCHKRTTGLVVHHKDGCPLNNDRKNLEVLCRSCHRKVHSQGRFYTPSVISTPMTGQSTKNATFRT
jgi:hypothetical protein